MTNVNRDHIALPTRALMIGLMVLLGLLLTGCYQPVASSIPNLTATQTTPIIPITPSIQATTLSPTQPVLSPSPTLPKYSLYLPPYLPEKMRSSITPPVGFTLTALSAGAAVTLTVTDQPSTAISHWIYTLVAPFPTITDGITSNEIRSAWSGASNGAFNGAPLLMDESTLEVLTAYWGTPTSSIVKVLPADQLLDFAWSHRPSWAIVPFENLAPRWKVLAIDGQSPIRKDFEPAAYILNIPFALTGNTSLLNGALILPLTNRDPSQLTTVDVTGVTALVRATAFAMENEGITYPAQDVGPILAQADITHISNEIPFSPDCPFPDPVMQDLVFCSSPRYIDLLKAVGTDVVELTGDHFMDYGADATLYTLQMYKDLGWQYYGGGADAEEARQPVKFENNGNRIAFMGCNVGCTVKNEIPCDAIATESHPGAAQCDFNYISNEIPVLRDQGYNVIFTFQHREYYTYTAEPILRDDFGLVAKAGATIVSGSQAHQPHGFAFQNDAFIHYGLGNLFFDQWHYCFDYACDDAFIDQHVFYDNRYISTELITIHFVDYARPRLMTQDERQRFLEKIFSYSLW